MMRKIFAAAVLGAVVMSGMPAIRAAEAAAQNNYTTEGGLAKLLVKTLGLSSALPLNPSERECYSILLNNGISPKGGWVSTNLVTLGNLARVVVQSLRLDKEVANPSDDNSWIEVLEKHNIHFDDKTTATKAVRLLGPIDPAFAADAEIASTDPLDKQARVRPPDDQQFGADLQPLRRPGAPLAPAAPVTTTVIQNVLNQVPGGTPAPRPAMTPS